MGLVQGVLKKVLGTPDNYTADKDDETKAPIQSPPFDLTQYAKGLAVVIGVIFPAVLVALETAKIGLSNGIVIAGLGVTGAALIAVCIVMAADIGARAYAHRSTSLSATRGGPAAMSSNDSPIMTVWLRGDAEPCPVIALERDGSDTLFLVLRGSTSKKSIAGKETTAYDDGPTWISSDLVTACSVRTKHG